MPANSNNVSSISIDRHTMQFILRSAIDALPARCFGLIGQESGRKAEGHKSFTITHTSPQAAFGAAKSAAQHLINCDLQHTLESWQQQSILPCGIYFSTENGKLPEVEALQSIEREFLKKVPACAESAPVLMPLMLNTAGCLEAFAYLMEGKTLQSVPLLLAEDGQQTKNG